MQSYTNNVQDRQGNAIAGAQVLVLKDGATAVIYSDNGITPATNPLTTDANGSFTFYGPTGNYSLTITSPKLPGPVEYTGIPILDPGDFDFTLRDDLASDSSGKGAELVSAEDGSGGTAFTTVAGFIARILSGVGAALVGFIQAGVGAVTRSVQDKLREHVSVKDFGAVGDGITDDTAAFQACLNYWQTSGNPIRVPAGQYLISAPLTATGPEGTSFVMVGEFCDTTEIVMNTGGDGLSVSVSGSWWGELTGVKSAGVRISHIRFSTNNANVGTGLKITGDAVQGRPRVPVILEYMQFNSSGGTDKSWATMTDILDAGMVLAHGCKWTASTTNSTVGLSLRGTAQANSPVHYKITSCEFTYGGRQIELGNFVEGVYVTGCTLVVGDYGVYWSPSQGESGLHIANCHMASKVACVYLNNVFDFNITGNLFFRSGGNSNHYTIHVQNGGAFTISGNVFKGGNASGGTGVYGINVQSTVNDEKRGGSISGNSFHDYPSQGVWLGANSYYVAVNSNSYRGCVLGNVLTQQASSNTIEYPSIKGTAVRTLTGGTTAEKINVTIPSGTFRAKPIGGFVNGSGNGNGFIGTYDYDDAGSTATNAVFTIRLFNNAVIPSGSVRFSYTLFSNETGSV